MPRRRTSPGGLGPRRAGRGARALRWVRRRRRLVAATLLAAAAGLTVESVAADPPDGVPVTAAARDLPAGQVLGPADVTLVVLPPEAVPDGTLTAADLDGRALSSPARKGEPLTDARLAGVNQLISSPPGTVAVPVPVEDAAALSLVRPGDAVRVIAGSSAGDGLDPTTADRARVLVQRAVVLTTPRPGGSNLLGSGEDVGGLVLAVSTEEAVRIADASGRRTIAVALLP